MDRRRAVATLAAGLAGCAGRLGGRRATDATDRDDADTDARTPTDGGAAAGGDPPTVGYTFGRPTGNRVVVGRGALPAVEPVDLAVDEPVRWLAAVGDGGSALWAAVLADGSAVGVRQSGRSIERVALDAGDSATDDGEVPSPPADGDGEVPSPPALADGPPRLLRVAGGSSLSHPVAIGDRLVAVGREGAALVAGADGAVERRLAVDALPDARPVTDGERAAVLSGATTRYGHGVLGDGVEAGRVSLVDPVDGVVEHRPTPGDAVVEGLAPILVDGDPLVTLADAESGARLALLTADGAVAGPPVGTGYRWRHQLAVAPFGPGGERELAAVRTPHIGGVAEFYRRAGDRLALAATRRGYSTHAIGSRNLDAALAGDLDGDGATELLVPTDAGDALVGLRRVASAGAGAGAGEGAPGRDEGDDAGSVAEAFRLSLPAAPTGNLAGASVDGATTVGIGLPDRLRLWPGEG